MDWDVIKSNWTVFKGNIKLHWSDISDSQLDLVEGRRDCLVRIIQAAYDISKEEADSQLLAWQNIQINIDGHFYEAEPSSNRK